MFSDSDMADLYSADMADAVVLSGESTPRFAMFTEAGQLEFGGEIMSAEPTLRYPVALWPQIARGTRLNVSGRNWLTRTPPSLLNDGTEAVVSLERAV